MLPEREHTVVEANRRRDHNHSRIKQSPQDAEGSIDISITPDQPTYIDARLPTISLRLFVETVVVCALCIIPVSVHGGLFAALANIMTSDTQLPVAETVALPSDRPFETPLLSAVTNPDTRVGGAEIVTSEGVLMTSGPVGADEVAAAKASMVGEISVYVVRPGDSLSQIAEMYGVTTNTILWANDLSSAKDIRPGDSLVILPIAGVQHTVKKGETLSSIVKKYEADESEVRSYNQLASSDDLSVGDTLIIPGGNVVAPVRTSVAPAKSSAGSSGGSWLAHPAPGALKTQGIHGFNAVDLAASVGTAVRAAAAGEVIVSKASGWNSGYGQYVVIRHSNGAQTLYAHLSSNAVAVGDWVTQGTVIGGMGNTGRSTGPHLHFEVRGASNPF